MKLGRKNLLYSGLIAGFLLIFLMVYFIGMLPSLYVDYVEGQYLDSIVSQHKGYLENKTYEGIDVKFPTNCVTLEIPKKENQIYVSGKTFALSIELKDKQLLTLVDEVKETFSGLSADNMDIDFLYEVVESKRWEQRFEEVMKGFAKEFEEYMKDNSPFNITILSSNVESLEQSYYNAQSNFHYISDSILIAEFKIQDGESYYSNYIAFTLEDDAMYISFLPAMTPRMNQLTPIVMQSLPMIIAVTLFIVLIFSVLYSKSIVQPIEELEKYTKNARISKKISVPPKCQKNQDEITALSIALHDLYCELQFQNEELEKQNIELEEDYKRQEVFLKSSSHQLKTPITAALLLVDGMMNKIGKYKDTDLYLKEVKGQLLSMKKMVEDILYLSQCENNIQLQEVSLTSIVKEIAKKYDILMQEKGIYLQWIEDETSPSYNIVTDVELVGTIIDNLISNAVCYGLDNSTITMEFDKHEFYITNVGEIAKDLKPHMFEPFVTSNTNINTKNHGLGLYIASYYAKVLNAKLTIDNIIIDNENNENNVYMKQETKEHITNAHVKATLSFDYVD